MMTYSDIRSEAVGTVWGSSGPWHIIKSPQGCMAIGMLINQWIFDSFSAHFLQSWSLNSAMPQNDRAQAWEVSCSCLRLCTSWWKITQSFFCSQPILMAHRIAYRMWLWLKHGVPMDSSIPAIAVSPSNFLWFWVTSIAGCWDSWYLLFFGTRTWWSVHVGWNPLAFVGKHSTFWCWNYLGLKLKDYQLPIFFTRAYPHR